MKKILIIEDDPIVRGIYQKKFTHEGFHVEEAEDGLAGMKMMPSVNPDLVILDLMLPKLSGADVLKFIRSQAAFKDTPVVVFSNSYMSDLVRKAAEAGATTGVLKSSCTPGQMVELVCSLLHLPRRAGGEGVDPAVFSIPAPLAAGPSERGPSSPAKPTLQPPSPASGVASSFQATDPAYQAAIRKVFLSNAPGRLSTIRNLWQSILKSGNAAAQALQLMELSSKMHSLMGNAGVAGCQDIANYASALEAFIKELHEKPQHINASTLHSVAQAVEFLGTLIDHTVRIHTQSNVQSLLMPSAPRILVVDDETLSNQAVVYSLKKANLKANTVSSPEEALKLLRETRYDLILLDVKMPGMDGFELCKKLRSTPGNQKTPVIFVTALDEFQSRAEGNRSGGNDFIAKPFLFIELTLKSLTHLLQNQLQREPFKPDWAD